MRSGCEVSLHSFAITSYIWRECLKQTFRLQTGSYNKSNVVSCEMHWVWLGVALRICLPVAALLILGRFFIARMYTSDPDVLSTLQLLCAILGQDSTQGINVSCLVEVNRHRIFVDF